GAVFKTGRGRVVLNDKTVPIGYPYSTVGSDLCKNRRDPFVCTSQKIKAGFVVVVGTVFFHEIDMQQMPGGFGYESSAVPIFFGESPGCVKVMTGCRSESSKYVDLSDFRRNRLEILMSIGTSTPIINSTRSVIAIGDGHIPSMGVIGGRSK